ncbi:MAG: hypothetical protein L3J89_07165 [Gammaproteobacteria bacterium]|nr:hypothetical protein [Gammaproteobacteria bacterium]
MINIITALQCEARPLIEYYKLRGNARHNAFRCYQNDDMQLIVSGIGKLSAATATTYLAASTPGTASSAWLNLGIAGHANKATGIPLLAHKLIDNASEQQWFPGIVMPISCDSETLTTVDKPEQEYRKDTMVDMEASGFYAAASRFQSCELIHSLKIISDNQQHTSEQITEKITTAMISDNMATIDSVINPLLELSSQLNTIEQVPAEIYDFMAQWHFTTYQQNELRHLLRRWHALSLTDHPSHHDFSSHTTSKAVLSAIKKFLDEQPISFNTKAIQ